jgi:hypothetical protein
VADDVAVLQAQKQYDLQVVERSIAKLEERLSYAFLLNTAIQRDAERVTAQEIRYMAQAIRNCYGWYIFITITRVSITFGDHINETYVSSK